jgi:ribosomal protein S25
MAKKAPAKKTAAAKKPAAKAAKKKAPAKKKAEPAQIVLSAVEEKAFDLVQSSKAVCRELEVAVTGAVAEAVQDVFEEHGIVLTASQSQNVAVILFGD